MKWIGLTGGIATGKSTAAGLLREMGVAVIDADELAKVAVARGAPALVEVAREFGAKMLADDGELDRAALGSLVFADRGKLRRLEAILHPKIQQLCEQRRRRFEAEGRTICFYDVPLLFEQNMEARFDLVVAVLCAPETQRARLIARNKLSEADADLRIAAQLPLDEKAKRAQIVIRNDGTLDDLRAAAVALLRQVDPPADR